MKYEFLPAETMNGTAIDKGLRNKDLIKEGNLGGTEINLTLTVDEAKAIISLLNLPVALGSPIGNDIKHDLNAILEFEEYK